MRILTSVYSCLRIPHYLHAHSEKCFKCADNRAGGIEIRRVAEPISNLHNSHLLNRRLTDYSLVVCALRHRIVSNSNAYWISTAAPPQQTSKIKSAINFNSTWFHKRNRFTYLQTTHTFGSLFRRMQIERAPYSPLFHSNRMTHILSRIFHFRCCAMANELIGKQRMPSRLII